MSHRRWSDPRWSNPNTDTVRGGMHGYLVHTRAHDMIKPVCSKTALKLDMREASFCSNRHYTMAIYGIVEVME